MSDPVVRGRPEAAVMRSISPPSEAMQAAALRRSGSLRALVPLAAGALLFWLGRPIASSIAVGLGALTLVLALVSPTRGYLALSRAIARLGEGVGLVLSWVLLGPVFFLFFVPFGLLGRRGRGDRIGRTFDRTATTYWITRPERSPEAERAALERPY